MATTFSVEVYDLERLFETYRSRLYRKIHIDTVLDLCDAPYERASGGNRAIVGSVRGRELAKLFADHGDIIFESNIRNYLGNVKINKQIMKTASDGGDAHNFWFYNNGVTFVCDEVSFRSTRDLSLVQLRGAQIINGCQTVTSLYRAMKEGSLRDEVEVLVRVIELPDPAFIRQVTLYTNSQNAVRTSDLVGTDAIQLDLQRRLRCLGYFYETRRGDFNAKYRTRKEAVQEFGEQFRDKIIEAWS